MIFQCIAAFVILALAVANASPLPYGAWGGAWGAPWAGPLAAAPWGHSVSGTYQHIAPHAAYHAPTYAAHIATPYAHADHYGHYAHAPAVHIAAAPHAASYVAANRGSVHTAPLPGHIASVASINDAPAPGTW